MKRDVPAILITGAGRRIGEHLARTLLERGERVIFTYRTPRASVEALAALGGEAVRADLSGPEGIGAAIEAIRRRTAALRAIIHNASAWTPDHRLLDDFAGFGSLVAVHMAAPYYLNHGCRDLLEAGEGPRDIIHLTDHVIERGSDKHAAYAATKAGLHNLTLSFARLLAPRVKVNEIAPALILFNDGDDPAYREKALAKSALGIEPGPGVILQAVDYLLESSYVTGETLHVNGGRNVR